MTCSAILPKLQKDVYTVLQSWIRFRKCTLGHLRSCEKAPSVEEGCWNYPDFDYKDSRHDHACSKIHILRNYGCLGVHYAHS